jgi:hypothetical protein
MCLQIKNSGKILHRVLIILVLFFVVFIGFNIFWDTASPQTTCASCHEIESSSTAWAHSGHRSFSCRECHGTAFSNGLHNLAEKGKMLIHHFTGIGQDIKLNETQVVDMLDNCQRCHSVEYTKWISGGHSATYSAIFLNEKHNSHEQPNPDCLRCHGMFFEGTIQDLVSPTSTKGPWSMRKSDQASRPVIPCLACHEIHRRGMPATSPNYSDPKKIFYERQGDSSNVLFYDRYEKIHREVFHLPILKLSDGKRIVEVSNDLRQRICIQCHAPNAFHLAGTSDDRTPRGIHEGISCIECHDNHSNNARHSCIKCHPAISNCGLDVTQMNTSFADRNSSHNIHFVSCTDCHTKGIPRKHPKFR